MLDQEWSRRELAGVALGELAADASFVNGRVLDVYSGSVRAADVAVAGGRIAAVVAPGALPGGARLTVDLDGATVVPGLIDTHLHLVSCHLTPRQLADQLVARGTAAVSACFYESGIVGGRAGLDWMRAQAAATDLDFLFSPFLACLRGVGGMGSTERLRADEFSDLVHDGTAVEIREWNVHLERLDDPAAQAMIAHARRAGLVIAGHLEGMGGPELQASAAAGASSDHEAVSVDEAVERVGLGVKVQIREGTAARNFDQLIGAIIERGLDPRNFMFCTDGQDAHHTRSRGHVDGLVARAVRAGVPVVDAVRMGSLNAAEYLRIDHHLGSIAPGRRAHLNIVRDLDEFRIDEVYVGERLVSEADSASTPDGEVAATAPPRESTNTVRVRGPIRAADLVPRLPEDGQAWVRVIDVESGVLTTRESRAEVRVASGVVQLGGGSDLAYLTVLDRHHESGRVGRGLVRGFGIKAGAVASTNSPALMNLMALGTDADDMALAARRVVELGGGIAVAKDGRILADLGLPVFGVFSDRSPGSVADELDTIDRAITDDLGSDFEGMLATAGFVMMPISIPGLKVCDRGLVRVSRVGVEEVKLPWDVQ